MKEFIINNYYVILIICVLLIFGIIGYIVDTLKNNHYKNDVNELDTYVPEEEVFIQNTENDSEQENIQEEEQSAENLIEEYNNEQKEDDSK